MITWYHGNGQANWVFTVVHGTAAPPPPPCCVHRCCRNYLGSIQSHVINKVLLAFEQYRHDCITHFTNPPLQILPTCRSTHQQINKNDVYVVSTILCLLVGSRYNSKIRKRSFTIIGMYLTELTVGQKGPRKRERNQRESVNGFFFKDRKTERKAM